VTDFQAFFHRATETLGERGLTVSVGDFRHDLVRIQKSWGYDTYGAFKPGMHAPTAARR
jgi:hypothetical protein